MSYEEHINSTKACDWKLIPWAMKGCHTYKRFSTYIPLHITHVTLHKYSPNKTCPWVSEWLHSGEEGYAFTGDSTHCNDSYQNEPCDFFTSSYSKVERGYPQLSNIFHSSTHILKQSQLSKLKVTSHGTTDKRGNITKTEVRPCMYYIQSAKRQKQTETREQGDRENNEGDDKERQLIGKLKKQLMYIKHLANNATSEMPPL